MQTNVVYWGDCLDVMNDLPAGSIDMVLCDLPYGTTSCTWDVIIPFDKLWKAYNRIVKSNGAIVLFGQEPFSSLLRTSNLKDYRYDWYWQKERLTNVMQVKRRPGKVIETLSVFYRKQCYYVPEKTEHKGKPRRNTVEKGLLGKLLDREEKRVISYIETGLRYPIQLLRFSRDSLVSNLHPTQKPVDLCRYLIRTYTKEGDIVLDNCLGSGTTAIAALQELRQFIGIESDYGIYRKAVNRIKRPT